MDWLEQGVYMVRDAAFGRNFTPKLWVSLIAIGLVFWDWHKQKRSDYLWVFLIATVIWAGAESLLSLQGTRDMPVREMFGSPIPMWISYLLQGTAEAGFVVILGLFIGDRLLVKRTRKQALILFAVICVLTVAATIRSSRMLAADSGIGSRRDLLAPTSLVALAVLVGIGIWFLIKKPTWRQRSWALLAVMLVFATVWTIAQVATSSRWIEVGALPGTPANPLISFTALAFDVVIEIAFAYLPFLAIPVLIGLIKDPKPLTNIGITT